MPSLTARKLADVAAVVKAAREDADVSQSELADRLAFSRDYMIDLESGKANLGITVTLTYGNDHADS
jgi:ribosome-binding protein aMBF1 (putative translation factor)